MSYAFIQSCSSAVGAHLTRQLLQRTQLSVVGSSRNPKAAREAILQGGGVDEARLTVLQMDTLQEETIEKAATDVKERFGDQSLKLLLNASGVVSGQLRRAADNPTHTRRPGGPCRRDVRCWQARLIRVRD